MFRFGVTENILPGFGFPSKCCSQCAKIPWSLLNCPNGFEQNSLSHGADPGNFTNINRHSDGERYTINTLTGIKNQHEREESGCGICRLVWGILVRHHGGEDPATMWWDRKRLELRHRICYVKMMKYGCFFADRRGERKQMIRRASLHVEVPCEGLGDNTGDSTYNVEFCIQPKDLNMPSLTGICNDGGAELLSKLMGHSGRERPPRIDVRCLSWWRRICDERHECKKKDAPLLYRDIDNPNMRLIDVREERIVFAASILDMRYVALSYVWGGFKKLVLTKDNMNELMRPDALTPEKLPKTIADAMDIVFRMGERYLWCDQLCIIQAGDNDEDKMQQINRMHQIYNQACFTIIAASGVTADSGLPGLHLDRIGQLQKTVYVPVDPQEFRTVAPNTGVPMKPIGLMATLSSQKIKFDHYLANHPWYGRGWTMQERVLSDRNLIFTNEQVYWECKEGSYCEESWFDFWQPRFLRESREPSLMPPEDVRESWIQRRLAQEEREQNSASSVSQASGENQANVDPVQAVRSNIWATRLSHNEFFGHYAHLVMRFSQRTFTIESDLFVGFLGITTALTERTGERFTWGFPEAMFECCLLWFGYSGPMRPVKATIPCQIDRAKGKEKENEPSSSTVTIPSWSWMAWRGPVQFLPGGPHPQVVCYTYHHTFMKKVHEGTNPHYPRNGDNGPVKMRPWRPNNKTEVTLSDVSIHYPRFRISPDRTADSILFFWASSAKFRLIWEGDPRTHGFPCLNDAETGESAGIMMQPNTDWWMERGFEGKVYEFLLLSTMSGGDEPDEDDGEKTVQVMQIEWKDGLAYRLNVGSMKESEWMRARPVWKLVAQG